jgi:hypothetical protein
MGRDDSADAPLVQPVRIPGPPLEGRALFGEAERTMRRRVRFKQPVVERVAERVRPDLSGSSPDTALVAPGCQDRALGTERKLAALALSVDR